MARRQRDYRGKVYVQGRGTVHVHHDKGNSFPAHLDNCIDERTRVVLHDTLPETATYMVTGSSLNATVERRAARLCAMPVVIPEGCDWLRTQIARITEDGGHDVVIVVYSPSDIY